MIRANTLRELQAKTTASLDRLAGQVASGNLSPADFVVQAQSILDFSHARAAVLGSFRAKRHDPPSDVAIRVAANASREQTGFLIGFARDLAEGKYAPKSQGGKGAGQRRARFALYSLRLGGTANRSFLDTLTAGDPGLEVLWIRKPGESCRTCIAEASYGWRPASELTRVPGDGTSICIVKCRCKLQTRQGQESYAL
jgi:hypothetical protein